MRNAVPTRTLTTTLAALGAAAAILAPAAVALAPAPAREATSEQAKAEPGTPPQACVPLNECAHKDPVLWP